MIATTTTIATSPDPAMIGDIVKFRATVASNTGSGFPTGSISFYVNSVIVGDIDIEPITGSAFMDFQFSSVGTHKVTARYQGDNRYSISDSEIPIFQYIESVPQLNKIEIINGNNQYAIVDTTFHEPIQVKVTVNGAIASNVEVLFLAALSGPSCMFESSGTAIETIFETVITDSNGIATSSVPKANSIIGSYNITITDIANLSINRSILTNIPSSLLGVIFILLSVAFNTRILMADDTWKPVQDIKPGDTVAGDLEGKKKYKVIKLNVLTTSDKSAADLMVFQQHSLGKNIPRQKLILSSDNVIVWKGKKYLAKHFRKNLNVNRYIGGENFKNILPSQKDSIDDSDVEKYNFYNLELETNGTFVAEGVVIKSKIHVPKHKKTLMQSAFGKLFRK